MKYMTIYRKFVLLSVTILATLMTSCTDFLTIIPPDKIVHEQFWQTKDDVNGMLATSYLKLASTDAISKAIVWGELRADNMTFEKSKVKDDIRYIVEANITDENGYARWGIYYQAINYANLVIEYAPLVVERDPDFTQGDLDVILGEMYAMRALCHFYLVRTFRDIPLAMSPAINDSELPAYEQVHPLEALKTIMNDLNIAEKLVMGSGKYSNKENNYGRITKNAVLAIKADVNLWLAAFTDYYRTNGSDNELANVNVQQYYNDCIDNCQAILDNIDEQYEDKKKPGAMNDDMPYHLISNISGFGSVDPNSYQSKVYDEIFASENSSESIFELQIDSKLCSQSSGNADGDSFKGLQNMYGAADGLTPQVEVPVNFLNKYEKDDLRKYSYTNYPYQKGAAMPEQIKVAKYICKASPAESSNFRSKDKVDANWIVYRQTDVMLMMAEALVLQPSANSEDLKKSFELVNVINKRSRRDTAYVDHPLTEPTDVETAHNLVLDERVRELSFEGKRWYDLVRKALRENTTDNIKFVAEKLTSGAATVKNKMVSIDHLFFPIHVEEIRFNKNLKQNPAYDTDDSTIGIKK